MIRTHYIRNSKFCNVNLQLWLKKNKYNLVRIERQTTRVRVYYKHND